MAAAASMLALLSGCISVPADTTRSAGPDAAHARLAADITLPADAWPAEQWWLAYSDPQLNALVARALRDNPTLAVAKARLAGARAVTGAEQADEGARLGLAGGANRQRYSSNGFFPPPLGGAWYNDF